MIYRWIIRTTLSFALADTPSWVLSWIPLALSSRGLGQVPFKDHTRVRIPSALVNYFRNRSQASDKTQSPETVIFKLGSPDSTNTPLTPANSAAARQSVITT